MTASNKLRGYDVLIVRLLPFFLFIDLGRIIYNSWNGIDTPHYHYFHSNSAIYASALFLISLANKHYHCVWNRAMYILLIAVPIFNYIESKFEIVNDIKWYAWIITFAYGATALFTAYKAIKHFFPNFKK